MESKKDKVTTRASANKQDARKKDQVLEEHQSEPGKVLIEASGIQKYFRVGDQDVHVLKGIDLKIESGDFVIIFGASGSGKSTLLHILLGLEPPTSGNLFFLGSDLYAGTDEDYRAEVRKKHIGMVYQQANWVKALSVAENIAFPLQLLGMEKELALVRARDVLAKFELEDWADYFPTELSSGQQQRISMARALVHNPMLIVADEPTGNLDYENGVKVMQLLEDMNKKSEKTIIMVTHDLDYLAYAHTAVQFFDGEVVGIFRGKDKAKIQNQIKARKQYSSQSETNKKNDSEESNDEIANLRSSEKSANDTIDSSTSKKKDTKNEAKPSHENMNTKLKKDHEEDSGNNNVKENEKTEKKKQSMTSRLLKKFRNNHGKK